MIPNYLSKLAQMFAEGKIQMTPGVQHVTVAHDDWCRIFRGGACNCIPDLVLMPGEPANPPSGGAR